MKLPAIALASAIALSGTAALANTVHHKSVARTDRDAVARCNCIRTAAIRTAIQTGPTTLSGTGDSQFGGSSPGTSGYN